MGDSLTARTVFVQASDTDVQAYFAQPEGDESRGGVVVIHHLPGFDRWTKEIVRRFAVMGYDAIAPNLYWREAPDASPDDAAALVRANGGISDDQLVRDVEAATGYLRTLPTSNGKVGVIGHCSGGRQAVLAGCRTDVDAVVDCYGAYVAGTPMPGFPIKVTNLVDQLPNLGAPVLGLFGNEDKTPSPEHVDELESILSDLGKSFEIHRYDGAGHGFFTTDRPAFRVEAALDGWERITTFFGTNLA